MSDRHREILELLFGSQSVVDSIPEMVIVLKRGGRWVTMPSKQHPEYGEVLVCFGTVEAAGAYAEASGVDVESEAMTFDAAREVVKATGLTHLVYVEEPEHPVVHQVVFA